MRKLLFLFPALVALAACDGAEKAADTAATKVPPHVLQVGPSSIMVVNVNTDVILGDQEISARDLGRAIDTVISRVKSGEVKPTPEVEYLQFNVQHYPPEGGAEAFPVGNVRVPLKALANAPAAGGDPRAFLDLVDHFEKGPDFDTLAAFCKGASVQPGLGDKFCTLLAS